MIRASISKMAAVSGTTSNIVRDLHKGSPGIGINFYALICTVRRGLTVAFIVPSNHHHHYHYILLPTKFVRIMRDARAPRGQLVHSSNLVGKCRALATVPVNNSTSSFHAGAGMEVSQSAFAYCAHVTA